MQRLLRTAGWDIDAAAQDVAAAVGDGALPVGEERGLLLVAFRSTTRPTPTTRWREASSARSW